MCYLCMIYMFLYMYISVIRINEKRVYECNVTERKEDYMKWFGGEKNDVITLKCQKLKKIQGII